MKDILILKDSVEVFQTGRQYWPIYSKHYKYYSLFWGPGGILCSLKHELGGRLRSTQMTWGAYV